MLASILGKLLPFIVKHAPAAVYWVFVIVAEAILGEEAKARLKSRRERKAFVKAIARAASQVAKEFPGLAQSFFDEHFLRSTILEEIKLFLTRHRSPSVPMIVESYENQFRRKPGINIAPAAHRFLDLVEECFKEEEGLQDHISRRQIDENNRILRNILPTQGVRGVGFGDTFDAGRVVISETPSLDSSVIETAFLAASLDLVEWPQTLDGGQWIERPELPRLLDQIATTDRSVSLVLGVPGSGKSALLARLAKDSSAKGWTVFAIRADQLVEDITTLDGLRAQYGLPAPILDCVRTCARDRKVVLIVDQLDSLSQLVDLKTMRLSVLLRLISQTSQIENVHVVSSCREFERKYDKRLNTLDADELYLALPSWETVGKILEGRGVSVTGWPETFREILRIPQCLKLFLKFFSGATESRIFESYQAMLGRLWLDLFGGADRVAAGTLIYEIATEMAKREVLFVPAAKYDARRQEVDYAVSVGFLQRDRTGRQISFVHQTLFDFARARAFVTSELSLSQYVHERQTGLFVRPTLWSALNYLRGSDPERYPTEFKAIWVSEDLRPHIRMLLIDFLGQQEQPQDFEIRILRPMFSDPYYSANAFAAITGQKAWFDVIASWELPEAMSAEPKKAWATLGVLSAAWPFAKERVLELINLYWVADAVKYDHAWFTLRTLQDWDRSALTSAVHIIERVSVSNRAVHDLATIISAAAPNLAPELLGAQLRKHVHEALRTRAPRSKLPDDATSEDIYAHIRLDLNDQLKKIIEERGEWFEISAVAKAAPRAYLEHVWPPVREAIEEISREYTGSKSSYRADYVLATSLEVEADDADKAEYFLMDSFVYAVRDYAKQDFFGFRAFVEGNLTSDALTVQRLVAIGLCEVASSNPQYCLDYLLGDLRRLSLGNFHESERETKMLLRAVIPNLKSADCQRLEGEILGANIYRDVASQREPKDRFHLQKYNRQFRLRLLLQFPKERLSSATRDLIESELRSFPGFKDRRKEVVMWRSESSMSAEEMERASDKTIAGFLGAYPDDTGWGERFEKHVGSVEVSRAFAQFAKKEPRRAIETILNLDPTTHQRPAAYAIREMPETEVADNVFFDLVVMLDGRGFNGEEFRQEAAHALLKRVKSPVGFPDPIIGLLERWLAEYKIEVAKGGTDDDGDKRGGDERTESVLWGYGGFYALPGGSYPIINALFFGLIARVPIVSEQLLSVLTRHLVRGDSLEIWNALASDTLTRLRYCDRTAAEEFLGKLFSTYPALLGRRSGVIQVASSLGWASPNVTREWISQIRGIGWSRASQAFGELLGLRTMLLNNDEWAQREIDRILDQGPSAGEDELRILCGLVHAAVNLWNYVPDRTLLKRILCAGMDRADKDVSAAALGWFRKIDELRVDDDTRPVLEELARGKALDMVDARNYTLDRLADVVEDAPELVYKISQRVLDIFGETIGSIAYAATLESETLLSIAMTLQRLEEPHRTHGLELFEMLLHYNAYKVRDVLMDIDRRPGMSEPAGKISRRRRERRPRRRHS